MLAVISRRENRMLFTCRKIKKYKPECEEFYAAIFKSSGVSIILPVESVITFGLRDGWSN